jgi:ketosteroid isomerase-like protein
MSEALARKFFAAADSREPVQLVTLLTEDVKWTFGNAPTTVGREPIVQALTPFFEYVTKMDHRIVGIWQCGDCMTVETRVTYVDVFGRTFSYPGCDLLFLRGGLISDVRIFVDNHELFIPPATAAAAAQ